RALLSSPTRRSSDLIGIADARGADGAAAGIGIAGSRAEGRRAGRDVVDVGNGELEAGRAVERGLDQEFVAGRHAARGQADAHAVDRKSTRLNSSHVK